MEQEGQSLNDPWRVVDKTIQVTAMLVDAKSRIAFASKCTAAWALVPIVFALLDWLQVAFVVPFWWNFAMAVGALVLAATLHSRTTATPIAVVLFVSADLVLVAYRLAELSSQMHFADLFGALLRIVAAPFVLHGAVQGYIGSADFQALKRGFLPLEGGWRSYINDRFFRAAALVGAALLVGVFYGAWITAMLAGLAQPGYYLPPGRFRIDVESITGQTVREAVARVAEQQEEAKKSGLKIGEASPLPSSLEEAEEADDSSTVRDDSGQDEAAPEEPVEKPEPDTAVVPPAAVPLVSFDDLDIRSARAAKRAAEFGASTDHQGCLLEGLGRHDRCRDAACRESAHLFLRACLPTSQPREGFCDGVPSPIDEAASAPWAARVCVGRRADACRELFYAVQGHCHWPMLASSAPTPTTGKVEVE